MKKVIFLILLIPMLCYGNMFKGGAGPATRVNAPQTANTQGITFRGSTDNGSINAIRLEAPPTFGGYTVAYRITPNGLQRCRWNGLDREASVVSDCVAWPGATGSISWGGIGGSIGDQADITNALAAKAALVNPAFNGYSAIGECTVPTAAANDDSTQVANTGWTKAAITNAVASVASGVQVLASDPASPDPGEAWINTTDSRFRVASAAGFYSYSGAFTSWDTTPDAFTFTDVTDATISTEYKASATLAGLNYATAVSIDGSGCQYSLNGEDGTYTALSGTASNGAVWLKQTSSPSPYTATTCTFTAGSLSDPWSVTTVSSVDYTFYWGAESTTLDYPAGTMSAVGSPAGFISSDRSGATGNVCSTDGTQVNGHWTTAITNHNIINPTSQGKIRMWVKAPTGSETANRYLIETVGQTGWFAVYIVANGRVEFDYGNGYALYGTGICTSGTCENLVRGQWYNLEFSWSGNNIYIKNLTTGAYRASTATVPPSGTATSLSINGNQGTGYAQMDDIYIYNTAGTP